MKTTRLILTGGFLGAGKTTLLWEAAAQLIKQGNKVGLITNDQAPELVDTMLLQKKNLKVAEVSGSCFCCNFNGLVQALNKVKTDAEADLIIAEPVGSCTDLSATILQPLKKNMNRDLVVSPLSVLADPEKLSAVLQDENAGLHPSAKYIFIKQLEESDIIVITKSDIVDSQKLEQLKQKTKKKFPDSDVLSISTKTGEGLEEWLKEVTTRTDAGKRLIDVDYDIYAEGEAVLGWLNANLDLNSEFVDWDKFGRQLMKKISETLDKKKVYVAHLKTILESANQYFTANLTGSSETLKFSGTAGHSDHAKMTLNARIEMPPKDLEDLVRQIIHEQTSGRIEINEKAWLCISPGRPEPTYRFDYVVPENLAPPNSYTNEHRNTKP